MTKMDKYHIIKRGNRFAFCKSGSKKAIRIFKYSEIAFWYACTKIKDDSQLVVHNPDGSVLFSIMPCLMDKIIELNDKAK
ncbi:MAG: hypothetical protein WC389_15840, partial [Lutibacter sp.]